MAQEKNSGSAAYGDNVKNLLEQYKKLREENIVLKERNLDLERRNRALETEIERLETDYGRLKLAKAYGWDEKSKRQANDRITRLVRDIDKCLELLNKETFLAE